MAFLTQRFMPYLKQLKADGKKVILCGDVNIVHQNNFNDISDVLFWGQVNFFL